MSSLSVHNESKHVFLLIRFSNKKLNGVVPEQSMAFILYVQVYNIIVIILMHEKWACF